MMEKHLKSVDNSNMSNEIYEIRDRTTRLESKFDYIVKSVTDHLDRWDKQWIAIDAIKERLFIMESLQLSIQKHEAKSAKMEEKIAVLEKQVSDNNTAKNTWSTGLHWVVTLIMMMVGVLTLISRIGK